MFADARVEAFIRRWCDADGSELANYQLFLGELCALLEVPQPDPAREDTRDNAYVFERAVTFRHGDGSESSGRIDLYRRGPWKRRLPRLLETLESVGRACKVEGGRIAAD